uniref:Uncharacterized protein n=1 Tax=Clandestinovirus TaxID=2831644 RepID=A0A8F8KTI9_9VIRU|nr:hypothetical protein KOM_12_512 [Clandestinovirus]
MHHIIIKTALLSGLFLGLAPGLFTNIPVVKQVEDAVAPAEEGKVNMKNALVRTGIFFGLSVGVLAVTCKVLNYGKQESVANVFGKHW